MPQPVNAQFTNAALIASQGAATRKLDTSLAKLAAASAVKPVAPAPADAAALTGANVLRSVSDTAPIRELGARLIDLRRILASTAPAGGTADAQSRIDASLAAIRKTATSFRAETEGALTSTTPLGPLVTYVRPGVTDISVSAPNLGQAEGLDVNVIVAQSAQAAGLRLSFGESQLDLHPAVSAPDARFVIEVEGAHGAQRLSFVSGASINDVANVINAHTGSTGVSATVSGTGIRLSSRGYAADDFVSVRVIDDGGLATHRPLGVYRYEHDNNQSADTATLTSFADAEGTTIRDEGQDLIAFVNGFEAITVSDFGLSAVLNGVKVRFDLGLQNAQLQGGFRAFSIAGRSGQTAVDRVASLDPKGVASLDAVALLDDAIREVERAERERLLAHGVDDPGATVDDEIPVIREAQARLLEEAKRLGLLIDHDAARALDALRQ